MLSNRWSILVLLFAVRTGMGLQYQAVAALSPLFMADFSLGIADIGLLIGPCHAPGAFLAFPGGAIGARLGDTRVVLTGLALMISGEVTKALAPAWSMQIAARSSPPAICGESTGPPVMTNPAAAGFVVEASVELRTSCVG